MTAYLRPRDIDGGEQLFEHRAVLDFADTEQVGAAPVVQALE